MLNFRTLAGAAFFAILLLQSLTILSQENKVNWDKTEISLTIDSIISILDRNYVFPEVADRMTRSLRTNLKEGQYDSFISPSDFATHLTTELYGLCHDKHLSINFNPSLIAQEKKSVTDEERAKREAEWIKEMKQENFGFHEVRILDGNIAYLDLRAFMDPKYAGETAISTMNSVGKADALIVDLRQNGGGSPAMIQLITSYFFSSQPVHLNSFYDRPANKTTQTWTLEDIPGTRRPDIELYILTSSQTFSAAEEFSYNLKNLKRATLVGEITGGGAHPTRSVIATDKFFVRVPSGRAINPITNTNWEGTGVKPDIEVTSTDALITAHIKALEKLRSATADSDLIRSYDWLLDGVKAAIYPLQIDKKILESWVGKYGSQNIAYDNGSLHYHSGDGIRKKLIPVRHDEFIIDGIKHYRLKFLRKDKAASLVRIYEDGRSEVVGRN